MPTPTTTFLDVAAKYGNVDLDDIEAVQRWFTEVLPGLPPKKIEEILEVLLKSEGAASGKVAKRSYPRGVPLPSLSASPQEPIPLTAAGWRELFIRWSNARRPHPPLD